MRCGAMLAAVSEHLEPLGCEIFCKAEGGYFLWLRLPEGLTSSRLLAIAQQHCGVSALSGERCAVTDTALSGCQAERYVRLCYAFYNSEEICCGIERLGKAIRQTLM